MVSEPAGMARQPISGHQFLHIFFTFSIIYEFFAKKIEIVGFP